MSRYYTSTRFFLPCDESQAEVIQKALLSIVSGFRSPDVSLVGGSCLGVSYRDVILSHWRSGVQDHNADVRLAFDVSYTMLASLGSVGSRKIEECPGLLFVGDKWVNDEQAARFVQAVLRAFDMDDEIIFDVVYNCSSTVLGGFSGCVYSITKDAISFGNQKSLVGGVTGNVERKSTPASLADGEKKRSERYYVNKLVEQRNGVSYPCVVLTACHKEEDPKEHLASVVDRLNANTTGSRVAWFSDHDESLRPMIAEVAPMGDVAFRPTQGSWVIGRH